MWRWRVRDCFSAVRPWEIDLERRASPDLTIDAHAPTASRDDAVHGRHAKPRTLAGFLGREERLEQASLHLRRHAGSRVRHGQRHVRSWLYRDVCLRVVLVELDV